MPSWSQDYKYSPICFQRTLSLPTGNKWVNSIILDKYFWADYHPSLLVLFPLTISFSLAPFILFMEKKVIVVELESNSQQIVKRVAVYMGQSIQE